MAILSRSVALDKVEIFLSNYPEWESRKKENFRKWIKGSNVLEKFITKNSTAKAYGISSMNSLISIFGDLDKLITIGREILGEEIETESPLIKKALTPEEIEDLVAEYINLRIKKGIRPFFPSTSTLMHSTKLPSAKTIKKVCSTTLEGLFKKLYDDNKIGVKFEKTIKKPTMSPRRPPRYIADDARTASEQRKVARLRQRR